MKKKTVYIALIFALLTVNTAFAELKAYSKDNKYLGCLVQYTDNTVYIYNELVSAFFVILDYENPGSAPISHLSQLYENENCVGTPYAVGKLVLPQLYMLNDKYYKTSGNGKYATVKSELICNDSWNCSCSNKSESFSLLVSEFTEISLPFTVPVQTPIHIVHEASGQTKAVVIPLMN